MPNSAASANNSLIVSRITLWAGVSRALRNSVGRGKRYTVKEASNGSGVPDRMIECAKCDPESPDWRPLTPEALISLTSFLGPDFTTTWLCAADQGAFWLPDDEEPAPGDLAADNADDNAVVARAAKDGIFDKDERRALKPVGLRMVARGAKLAGLDAAA